MGEKRYGSFEDECEVVEMWKFARNDGVRWRWRVLSEFERVGWWSDDPELPLPLPECWLPTIVSEDADADGDLCHGG